ncbi:MAG: TIGR04149 family rSAM-modified RiPP [Draconibacterium sp.]
MKTLKKIKLNQLSKVELKHRQMNDLRGGSCDGCTCVCSGDLLPSADNPASTSSNKDVGPSEY